VELWIDSEILFRIPDHFWLRLDVLAEVCGLLTAIWFARCCREFTFLCVFGHVVTATRWCATLPHATCRPSSNSSVQIAFSVNFPTKYCRSPLGFCSMVHQMPGRPIIVTFHVGEFKVYNIKL